MPLLNLLTIQFEIHYRAELYYLYIILIFRALRLEIESIKQMRLFVFSLHLLSLHFIKMKKIKEEEEKKREKNDRKN